ncbi:MAG: sulfatase [Vicinamibacteria bacterium]|nr:sulfatase [Vicinamibacteria bacterium]
MVTPLLRGLFFASFALSSACGPGAQTAGSATRPKDRPNLIVVVLDDADVGITESMPRFRSLFMEQGVRFTSNLANTPLCGPARALLLTGQYAHNTKVYYNNGPEGGYTPWRAGGYDEGNIGVWLKAAGYRTGLFGKYMNDFPLGREETFVPKGWDDFRVILSDREARNNHFTLSENGVLKLQEAGSGGYQTDVLSRRMREFIRAKKGGDSRPFFAYLALSAPHVPPEPAERHRLAFPDEKAPRKPSFDEADISDKPKALRDQAEPLTPWWNREIDKTYREMRQSLLSVEEAMDALIKTLEETGELSNTYIFFTSDNGWFRGEHRIPTEKYAPYEESIRVPLFVRGPGVPAGRTVSQVVGLVDLPATLLDLAGAPGELIASSDGRSLVPLLHAKGERVPWRESILIEHFGGGAPFRVRSYSGIRSENDVYVEYASGETEYYDLIKDPYQMENTAGKLPPALLANLSQRVKGLETCAAATCRAAEGVSPAK